MGESQIVIVNADGSDPRPITSEEHFSYAPEWSPDGQRIAFMQSKNGEKAIYTIRPDGSGEALVTIGSDPKWSPDGQTLLFNREKTYGTNALYRINADGSGEIEINPKIWNHTPESAYKWSPNGRKIAFIPSGETTTPDNLVVTTDDGSEVLWQYNLTTNARITNYAWSPDSQQLLVLNDGDFIMVDLTTGTAKTFLTQKNDAPEREFGHSFAWLTDRQVTGVNRTLETSLASKEASIPSQPYYFMADTNPVRLYRFDGHSTEVLEASQLGRTAEESIIEKAGPPSWSPDGTQLVFEALDQHTKTQSLFLMNIEGSNFRLLTPLGFNPRWSPDGKHIGFRKHVEDGKTAFGEVGPLYVIDTEGSDPILITDQRLSNWEWSPDGQRILYSDKGDITVVNVDGTNSRVITKGFSPSWSPDGDSIAFDGNQNFCICIIPVDGDDTPLEIAKGRSPVWSPDGNRIVFLGGARQEIVVANADGTDLRVLTSSEAFKYSPA